MRRQSSRASTSKSRSSEADPCFDADVTKQRPRRVGELHDSELAGRYHQTIVQWFSPARADFRRTRWTSSSRGARIGSRYLLSTVFNSRIVRLLFRPFDDVMSGRRPRKIPTAVSAATLRSSRPASAPLCSNSDITREAHGVVQHPDTFRQLWRDGGRDKKALRTPQCADGNRETDRLSRR
jgi:hypothetical protein